VTALLRNDVQMVCLPAISIMPQLGSAALRALAVSTAERSPLLPDIPTLTEAGIEVEADAWSGLIAPAGISQSMPARIGRLVGETMRLPAIRDNARIDGDIARWSPVIAAAKIKME